MPCYQMNLVSVEFKAKHVNVLEAAAKALGWSFSQRGVMAYVGSDIRIDLESQRAIVSRSYQNEVNRLKVAYSTEAVKLAAKKKKWFVKQKAAQKLELRRY